MPLMSVSSTISELVHYIPFVGMVAGSQRNSNPFITRILEAIIIALFAGYISGKITLAVMEVRLDSVESKVSKIFDDIYAPSIPKGD
jgi:hypothetical protein